ncbi:MAG: hypothetical protein ACRDPM_09345, partial [Solirubrobacteraceae bacterium]
MGVVGERGARWVVLVVAVVIPVDVVVDVVALVVVVSVLEVVSVVDVVGVVAVDVVVVCVLTCDVLFFCWRAPLVGVGLPWFAPLGLFDFVCFGLPLWLPGPAGPGAPKLTRRVAVPADPVLVSV